MYPKERKKKRERKEDTILIKIERIDKSLRFLNSVYSISNELFSFSCNFCILCLRVYV